MGGNPNDFDSGFSGALGTFFGTLIGRIFLGATMLLGGTAIGTKVGAPDRFTGTEGDVHWAAIQENTRYRREHDAQAIAYKKLINEHAIQLQACAQNIRRLERDLNQLENEVHHGRNRNYFEDE